MIGCTINDAKPLICQLYPFNTIHVTRICLMKMQSAGRTAAAYDGCFVFDLDRASIVRPDFEALAAHCIRLYVYPRILLDSSGDHWQEDMAEEGDSHWRTVLGR